MALARWLTYDRRMTVSLLGDPASAGAMLAADLEYAVLLRQPNLREQHLAREVRRVAEVLDQGGFALQCKSTLALLRPLGWDSTHFGLPCADLLRLYAAPEATREEVGELLAAVLEEVRRRGVGLLSARIRADQLQAVQALEELGLRLVDTSVEIGGLRPLPEAPRPPGLELRDPLPGDCQGLEEVAASFTANRFYRDPRIPRDKARQVYLRWVAAAAEGRRGKLLVAELDGLVAGFATYLPADDELGVDVVGLLAVHPRCRGAGLLTALVEGCAERLAGRALVTSTQVSNASALRGFARAGLLPFAARHVMHGWL